MKVILVLPDSDGEPVDFEALPEVGEVIRWSEGTGSMEDYRVTSRVYAFNQISRSVCPYLTIEPKQNAAKWIEGMIG